MACLSEWNVDPALFLTRAIKFAVNDYTSAAIAPFAYALLIV
jgi:hypothetical protein